MTTTSPAPAPARSDEWPSRVAWRRRHVLTVTAMSLSGAAYLLSAVVAGGDWQGWPDALRYAGSLALAVAAVGVVWWLLRSRTGTSRSLLRAGTPETVSRVRRTLRRGAAVSASERAVAQLLVDRAHGRRWAWVPGVLTGVFVLALVLVGPGGSWPTALLGTALLGTSVAEWWGGHRLLRGAAEHGVVPDDALWP